MRKRSKYRQQPRNTNPLAPLVPMDKTKASRCMLDYYTALNSIIAGRFPGPSEWRSLADLCNVCERLARRGSAPRDEVMPLVDVASMGMRHAAKHYEATGEMKLLLSPTQALQELLQIHQQFLETFPEREVMLVVAETRADIIETRKRGDTHVVTL